MSLLSEVIQHFKLILILGKNDFKNKYLGSGLGSLWGFLNPLVQLLTYTFVYQVIFPSNSDIPFIVGFFPVLIAWMFISETLVSTSASIRNYSYLVKKIKFPIDIIPLIPLVSAYIVFIALNLFVIIINASNGYFPNLFLLIYMHICLLSFIIAFGRLFSALNSILPDVSHLISSSMQVLFWLSPIIWNFDTVSSRYAMYLKLNPLAYILDGFRAIYISNHGWFNNVVFYTLWFWLITSLLFVYGNHVFNKCKKDFADTL